MQETRSEAQEAAEDVFFGQVVINWARWFIIAAGVVLVLMTADKPTQVVVGILPVVGLMAMNFYLHGRRLAERPANRALISLSSVLDLAAVTAVVLLWPGAAGLRSEFFIMYYPVVLAFAFVMPPRATIAYTLVALAAYAGACFLAEIPYVVVEHSKLYLLSSQPGVAMDAVETLVTRLITLGAMGALGTYYWRVQRNRRRAAAAAEADGSPSVVAAVS